MSQIVDLPNGQQAEFPDEMSPDQISSIIQKQFPPIVSNDLPQKNINTWLGKMERPNIGNFLQDKNLIHEMINTYGGGSPNNLINMAQTIPNVLRNMPIIQRTINTLQGPITGAAIGVSSQPENPILGGITGSLIGSTPIAFNTLKGLGSTIKNAFNKIPSEKIGESIQSGHDILKKEAEDIFKNVGSQVKERNIPIFPVDKSLISSVSEHLPKDRITKNLLKEAESGNYEALRDLQSDLFHEGTLAKKSDYSHERRAGKEMLDLRNRINESIFNHLKNTDNKDLSELLKEGMQKYKNVLDIYYAKKLPSAIKNMVHPESREIPNNISQLMSKKSVPINRIHQENPLASDLSKQAIAHENAIKKLKVIGAIPLGLGSIAGLAEIPSLYHKIFG